MGEYMRRLQRWASVVTAIVVTACATTADEDVPDELTEPTANGVNATASVTEIITNSTPPTSFPKIQFNVKVTLANTTGSAKTITYRAGCSVRIQLRAADDSNLYDETARDCDPGLATITIPAQSQQLMYSGIRFPTSVLGDSLAPGRYRVVAVFQRDDGALHIEAGAYSIPLCDNLGCRSVGSGAGKAEK
jgi:hypothetical protein